MKEAEKLKDIFDGKSLWRYIKKGIFFVFLFGFIATLINLLAASIISTLGINLSVGIMPALRTGGFKVAFVLFASIAIQWFVAGFLIEYISNSRAKIIQWARK